MPHGHRSVVDLCSARSFWRPAIFVALVMVLGGSLVTTQDVGDASRPGPDTATSPAPPAIARGAALSVDATASCQALETSVGIRARSGIAAANATWLPLGSVIRMTRTGVHNGVYTILHDRPTLDGRAIDFFVRDCADAERFGERAVRLEILRVGWLPSRADPEP